MDNRTLFLRHLAQTSDAPIGIEIEKANGCFLYAPDGKRYLDLISGISVSNVGHRHPHVLHAIEQQLQKHLHLMVYGEYVQSVQVRLAEALVSTLPAPINNVYFVNSGSEAIEGAMKLAKRATGRAEIISCFNAYHGSSQGALSIMGSEYFKQAYRPLLPGIRHIHYGSFSCLEKITQQTAAVVIETVQGEAGVRVACETYFKALAQRCSETDTLLILDEIQCGFGRTGDFWAFQAHGIVPDIIVCAKGMGGGLPIGAFMASAELMHYLKQQPVLGHITTFGGNAVCCAAALATLEIVKSGIMDDVRRLESIFWQRLVHPHIKALRSKGFLMAIELGSNALVQEFIQRALRKGLITDWFLFCDTALRVAPPLVITEAEVHEACDIILSVLDEMPNA
jgi:acetylornithine/succinyldiaminopimelate/putrescine aminotransferase